MRQRPPRRHRRAGWVIQQATAINHRGRIVGLGLHDGVVKALLMTPLAR